MQRCPFLSERKHTMEMMEYSCQDFVRVLASKEPVPGGGGASALVGALGAALGNMVGSLTVGKKKYASVENEMHSLMKRSEALQNKLLNLVEEDAKVFLPLSQAYALPKSTAEELAHRQEVMAVVLKDACDVPLQIMQTCCEVLLLLKEFAQKGSALAISDAGVGAALCRGALEGASLNVFINTKSMEDRALAEEINQKANALLLEYTTLADTIFADVKSRLE